jgi:hypothetical protein
MAKHIHIYVGSVKARDAKQHYDEGSMAATKGIKYDANPYKKGSQEHLDWSKGHNDLRAKRAKDTDYSKWYNAELAQELRWDVKTYPKGMKVKARRGDKSGNWIVDFPDGTRNGMREAELKFNEPVKDSTEGSLFHAGHMDKKSKDAGIIGTLATAQRDLTRISADLRALSSNEHVLTNRFSVDKAAGATRTALEAVEAAIKANPR